MALSRQYVSLRVSGPEAAALMSGRPYHYVETIGVQVEFMPDYLRAGDDVLELRPIRAKDREVSTACRICLRAELAPALITALLAIERERNGGGGA